MLVSNSEKKHRQKIIQFLFEKNIVKMQGVLYV